MQVDREGTSSDLNKWTVIEQGDDTTVLSPPTALDGNAGLVCYFVPRIY